MNNILSGAVISDSVILEDGVEIGHNSVILSGSQPDEISRICHGAVIGSNCTIYKGVTIGQRALIMPGSVVKQSIPPLAIVEGNPANITGYVETTKSQEYSAQELASSPAMVSTSVSAVKIYNLLNVLDLRGNLTVGEFDRHIPFSVKRFFLVYDVPTLETRGEHAHIECKQFLVAVKGSIHVIADDGVSREEFTLDRPTMGLYLPPMTWGVQYRYSSDAVLLVFASDDYDASDYIRNYDEFIEQCRKKNRV
ncbi:WxcM-like domain-containing protein [Pseudomonadota bacterium]